MYKSRRLIVVDAGHGGYDNGASFDGRLEKDDNLKLARAVAAELEMIGQDVLMTRDSDIFVSLSDRVNMANNADADFFVSLHRNSYEYETPYTKGVDAYIYTTAPISYETYARIILDKIVEVGVQSDNGVKRDNFYVLRLTEMPAVLLEMGFIINEEDNRLFDENLQAYARAIAYGIMESLGEYPGGVTPEPSPTMLAIQMRLNSNFGLNVAGTGVYNAQTRSALIKVIQITLNSCCAANLTVDGIFGPMTANKMWNLVPGSRGDLVWALQSGLYGEGYDPGFVDGKYGSRTTEAVRRFQRERGLVADGIAGRQTFMALFS